MSYYHNYECCKLFWKLKYILLPAFFPNNRCKKCLLYHLQKYFEQKQIIKICFLILKVNLKKNMYAYAYVIEFGIIIFPKLVNPWIWPTIQIGFLFSIRINEQELHPSVVQCFIIKFLVKDGIKPTKNIHLCQKSVGLCTKCSWKREKLERFRHVNTPMFYAFRIES